MIRVGLIGAGPWARDVHGPGLVAAPGVRLTGLWARRPEATTALATRLGVASYPDADALIGDVDAVALAVAPAAQGDYGLRAAMAGKHLILDKPLASDLSTAEQLVDASTRLVTAVFVTARYTPGGREFLARAAADGPWSGAAATWVSGSVLAGRFADSPWRQDGGALFDLGPHAVDLLCAALGPVARVIGATRSEPDYVALTLRHDAGAVSQVALSLRVPTQTGTGASLFGPSGQLDFVRRGEADAAYATMLAEFVASVRGDGPPPTVDAAAALQTHRVLVAAQSLLQTRL